MTRVVLDSSYAMSLALPDESPPASSDEVLSQALIAPHIFNVEITNASLNGVRRKRYGPDEATRVCEAIHGLGVAVQMPPDVSPTYHLRLALAHATWACHEIAEFVYTVAGTVALRAGTIQRLFRDMHAEL